MKDGNFTIIRLFSSSDYMGTGIVSTILHISNDGDELIPADLSDWNPVKYVKSEEKDMFDKETSEFQKMFDDKERDEKLKKMKDLTEGIKKEQDFEKDKKSYIETIQGKLMNRLESERKILINLSNKNYDPWREQVTRSKFLERFKEGTQDEKIKMINQNDFKKNTKTVTLTALNLNNTTTKTFNSINVNGYIVLPQNPELYSKDSINSAIIIDNNALITAFIELSKEANNNTLSESTSVTYCGSARLHKGSEPYSFRICTTFKPASLGKKIEVNNVNIKVKKSKKKQENRDKNKDNFAKDNDTKCSSPKRRKK